MEFHISRDARDRYQFDRSLFSSSGNVLFGNFRAARLFAQKMNDKRDLERHPEEAVRAGQINAMGLIDEILHYVIYLYRQQMNPNALAEAKEWIEDRLSEDAVEEALRQFVERFPPVAVYQGRISVEAYLADEENRREALEEMLLLWVANANPAFGPFQELFDDSVLKERTAYEQVVSGLHAFFDDQPPFGPDEENLIDMVRSPAIAVPDSLSGQLEFIRDRWGAFLGDYLRRLLSSLDMIAEEEKVFFMGPGPAEAPDYSLAEYERFSPDQHWMPEVVLIAKNVYVWLDQLSKQYQRAITRLDQIPNEELELLARRGFTGLWLIGLWERSPASKRIKQTMGNPEAVASAYSLLGYRIAEGLGGHEAMENLRARAWQHGVRLASDMVPNHMGIDSDWVMNHPDWFISLDHTPFPAYSFNGPDLSWDDRVGIYLEDHYYDRTDAAVVFKRVDHWTGDTKYIYHGNDGTSMPWNDTAQLNFLKEEVREAVIQTILRVARDFPIIRFDAAMTLAKKHYQRLWFPRPGSGGDIPSRAEHGLTKAEFDAAMPHEFWREVVDRVAEEVPDTLLLAEAFWFMEGYFVRTLGMHRVYNSAFMNMLRDEANAKYREVIKKTLEFDPQILKRYVNFMNNPDERTAVDQFGKGDKYFGICAMMATLPGLPMFGHGQIEGFAEKYGMEYRRAYWDETPDQHLVERHEREIFPLLRKRHLFAEVDGFMLYDLFTPEGHVDENVFVYSNRTGDERGLVVYHNRYAETRGWARTSVSYLVKTDAGEHLAHRTLGQGLGLRNDGRTLTLFRDQITGLTYIRHNRELFEKGLYVELKAYQYHVFVDFRQVEDDERQTYSRLATRLNGRGMPDIESELKAMALEPVHQPLRSLLSADFTKRLHEAQVRDPDAQLDEPGEGVLDRLAEVARQMADAGRGFLEAEEAEPSAAKRMRREAETLLQLGTLPERFPLPRSRKYGWGIDFLTEKLEAYDAKRWATLMGWLAARALADLEPSHSPDLLFDELMLDRAMHGALRDAGLDDEAARHAITTVRLLISQAGWCQVEAPKTRRAQSILNLWLEEDAVRRYMGINEHEGMIWFNQEAFDQWLWWMMLAATVALYTDPQRDPETLGEAFVDCYDVIRALQRAAAKSDYQLERLIERA